ncbi:MAG: phosphate/phosphite/phosphonate ABC transporter substrate-binding protein [Candidatus Thiodiazotropha sp.]
MAVEPLVLGIHPYRPYTELKQMFAPLAAYLEREIGNPVEVRVGESYNVHLDAVVRGDVTLAYIGPSLFVELLHKVELPPRILARLEVNGQPTFTGKIITRTGSSIHSLADLRGKRFAFGSPESTMSHLVPRQMLFEAGIHLEDLDSYHFYNNHNNVVLAVLAGDADAGAVKEAVYDQYHAQGVVAIATTPEISEHLFVTPEKTDPILVERLQTALLKLTAANPETHDVLFPIKHTATALVTGKAEDYQSLEQILKALSARGVTW